MTFFITGASRGIGLELVKQSLAQGATVLAAVRNPQKAHELSELGKSSGSKLKIIELDASSDASVERARAALGPDLAIDVLINNAGVYLDKGGEGLSDLSLKVLHETLETNTLGPVRVTKALAPSLAKSKSPKVINISSLMGSMADNGGGGAYAYRISKTALNMFTKNLAIEKRGWVVLSMHPGWVQTDMGGSGATVSIPDSARGILKLISEAGSKDSGRFFDFRGRELPW